MSWIQTLYILLVIAVVLDHAHLVCPLWLGWGNGGFRRLMLERPEKFVLLPAICVFAAFAIGAHARTTRDLEFRVLAGIYFYWNAWHFGAQHFGVASLLGWRSGPRWMRQAITIGPTVAVLTAPVGGLMIVVVNEMISLVHWLTDIGLTTFLVKYWWLFLPAVICVGFIGFEWKVVVVAQPRLCGLMPACTAQYSAPMLLSLRYGLGFWHFLMSRWVWKLSDPQVRATIGINLLRQAT